ncbi:MULTISPECIES: hypothetical protein [Prauserella salsuginis group]|uniref:Mg/Co/Ni transporter MgtE n=2 Tax=Prauserella salsuginis group TaxID=2893672 RepID=A0A839XUI7_9PSEU|nr:MULTISPECIES: hypothetical protein [Prauserella salsuginis group]MBB3666391.1 Mg/Co/Ni transporter MgtE [Prauserella sediminis]MCR3719116.1 hypothetical protein [Prauserella flava]MCR3732635.1 hypothetical protein [Prauserella salsuginis]
MLNTDEPTKATRVEKREALLSILGNGLYLVVVGGVVLAVVVGALFQGEESIGAVVSLLVTLALVVGVIAAGVRLGTRRR